jgi:hypothetical protein
MAVLQHTELRIDGPGNPATASGAQPSAWVANSAPRHSSALFGAWEFHPRWQVSVARRWVGGMSWYRIPPTGSACIASSMCS